MKSILTALFGGTFGYIQAGLIGLAGLALVWLWQDYKSAKKETARLAAEIGALHKSVKSKDGIIASLGRSANRRAASGQNSKDLGDDILQVKDGQGCAASEPMAIVLDGLRERAQSRAAHPAAKPVPVLEGAYPAHPD